MQHLDEGTIHAWLDGALDAEEAARVEQHAAACDVCAAAVAEARGLMAGASRILASLDNVPAGVIPRSSAGAGESHFAPRRSRPLWNVLHLTPARAAAAALVFVAGGTVLVLRNKPNEARDTGFVFAKYDTAARVGRATPPAPIASTAPQTPSRLSPPAASQPIGVARRTKAAQSTKVATDAVVAGGHSFADTMAVSTTQRLTVQSENRAVAAAPSPMAADAAKSVASAGVGGAPSAARAAEPMLARMRAAPSRTPGAAVAGCYSVEGDSLPMLPRRIVLETSNAEAAGNALQAVTTRSFSVAERHAIGAIAGDTILPVSGWHWSSRPGGVRLEMATPSAAAAQLDSTSTAGDLRGTMSLNGGQLTVFLRRVACPMPR